MELDSELFVREILNDQAPVPTSDVMRALSSMQLTDRWSAHRPPVLSQPIRPLDEEMIINVRRGKLLNSISSSRHIQTPWPALLQEHGEQVAPLNKVEEFGRKMVLHIHEKIGSEIHLGREALIAVFVHAAEFCRDHGKHIDKDLALNAAKRMLFLLVFERTKDVFRKSGLFHGEIEQVQPGTTEGNTAVQIMLKMAQVTARVIETLMQ